MLSSTPQILHKKERALRPLILNIISAKLTYQWNIRREVFLCDDVLITIFEELVSLLVVIKTIVILAINGNHPTIVELALLKVPSVDAHDFLLFRTSF